MKNYKATIGAVALAGVALVGSQMAVNAYQGDYTKKGPNFSEERHQVMTQSFENGDYEAWKTQMEDRGRTRVTEVVTKENFDKFAEAHRLGLAGDIEGADAIRAELGLRTSNGERGGQGFGKGEGKGQGQGSGNGEYRGQNRGQNNGGKFVDSNGDGTCDNLN